MEDLEYVLFVKIIEDTKKRFNLLLGCGVDGYFTNKLDSETLLDEFKEFFNDLSKFDETSDYSVKEVVNFTDFYIDLLNVLVIKQIYKMAKERSEYCD